MKEVTVGMMSDVELTDEQYRELLQFRTALRRFLHRSDGQAQAAGLTTQQHQLLLAIRGHADPGQPTIGDIADALMLRHHSAVELANRAEQAGLVNRRADRDDRRVVHLRLTSKGERILARLSATHLDELARLAPTVERLARGLDDDTDPR